MALSGTLETFSLPDVLRLLSSTKKTGLLALDGDRGRGRIWVRDGAIVGADADRAVEDAVEGVALELLRFVDARFEFDSGAEPGADGEPRPVDDVLAEAESRLAEWREIEAIVPSLDVWVRMVTELDGERTVAPNQWRVLAQVGTGADGHVLADRLGQGEYDVCRQLRDLIEIGLVELDEAPVTAAPAVLDAPSTDAVDAGASWSAPSEEPTFVEPALDQDAVSSLGADLASFVAVGTVEQPPAEPDAAEIAEPADTAELEQPEQPEQIEQIEQIEAIEEPADEPDTVEDEPVTAPAHLEVEVEDEDVLSQLSQLSPKAAAAVEATWDTDAEPAEPQATEPAPEPGRDEIDQNLLLRFLSSTKH
ncbi:DUF4388 domain-containing protein [Acidimicrobiia bacterium EGI L10123]|uniref:DUF4388 domain-containing protein n=1 Tax=Salinilacustrithrix flava TaxID=2957203 RepID=UPI003D7C2368|nr:DUF4388 domain-containing protein [Acidimicrobiia bacterium EGI L10123]